MNLEKSQLKVDLATNLGADIEDRLEGERKSAHELAGAAVALRQAAKKVPRDLAAKIDTALDEGEVKDMTALQAAEFAKKYLMKAGDFLIHLSEVESQKSIAQSGRVDGLRDAMKAVQKMRDLEIGRIQAMLDAIEEDGEPPRTQASVAREAHGSVADRRAEAQASKGSPEDQSREAHGSVADRRAASKGNGTTKRSKKKTSKKTSKKKTKSPALRAMKKV